MTKKTTGGLSKADLDDIKSTLKDQIIEEMKDDRTRLTEESKKERQKQTDRYAAYVAEMKESTEPWVDVTGWTDTDQGVKVELDWNNAFLDYLAGSGIKGVDEDKVVQQWITLLLRDMADQMDDNLKDNEFEQ